jgi:hypothetical protein
MGFGGMGAGRRFGGMGAPLGTVGASSFAPYPAPPGYHWEFVTSNGQRVTSNGVPVVVLVAN